MAGHERTPDSAEKTVEFDEGELGKVFERASEQTKHGNERPSDSAESRVEKARHEAKQEALDGQKSDRDKKHDQKNSSPAAAEIVKKATKQAKEAEYQKTMKLIRSDMKPASRAFSKLIHNPVVEKTSQVLGSTIARPNAILAGSLSALIITGALYAIFSYFGYAMSGFETIGAFAAGWIIGIIIDYVRVTLLGKRTP